MCPYPDHGSILASASAGTASAPGEAPDPALVADLVTANHIRHDKRPDRFLLARNMAPGSVTADDILEFDLDGNPVDAGGRKPYLERFIHGELYRARPDVQAVVHSHSHSIVPLSVVKGLRLRALCHMAGFIGEGAPVFEIRGGERALPACRRRARRDHLSHAGRSPGLPRTHRERNAAALGLLETAGGQEPSLN